MSNAARLPSDKSVFLDKLFGMPTSTGILTLPGATPDSARKLIDNLKRNFVENHAYFNDEGFHKYVPTSKCYPCH